VPTADLYRRERELSVEHGGPVAGIDEAGRGPLAGPVVAAAVILRPDSPLEGLGDSKAMSPGRREKLFSLLLEEAVAIGIGWSTSRQIDRFNVLRATHRAMARAASRLSPAPVHLIVDGLEAKGLPFPQTAVVKGDARCACVGAASVVAKVVRDRHMTRLARRFPAYGFDRNMGYPTADHRAALARHGPCWHHRTTFAPVRESLEMRAFE
jgi:ribonuclease HII